MQPFKVLHSARRPGPAAEWMAPSCGGREEGLVKGGLSRNDFL